MSKNGNENISLKNSHKKIETEQKLINEGIIFKRRILSHKNESIIVSPESYSNKNDSSIKVTEQYIKRNKKSIKYDINNSIPFNSVRAKKASFSKMCNTPINDATKASIQKTNYIKATNINRKKCSPIQTLNNSRKNILNGNTSCKRYNNNNNRKSLNIIDFNDKNILFRESLSPRISISKLENGHISPIERNKYYINTNIDKDNGYEKQKFNYKKWNKITINNIFERFANNNIKNKMYESPKTNNNCIDKENNGLMSNQNKININKNGIQEIVIPNINKQKKRRINDIPLNRKKVKSKGNFNKNIDIINRNNIFNYCKQMSNLALTKDEKNNYIGETVNGLRFDRIIRSPEPKNKIEVDNNGFKRYKSSNKKINSNDIILRNNITYHHLNNFTEFDINNQKSPLRAKNSTKHTMNKNLSLNSNIYNIDNTNKGIFRNENHSLKQSANTEINEEVIKIKNSNLIDFIKTDDIKINNKKIIVFNKYKEEDIIKEDNTETKKGINDINEDIFNSKTDIFNEKEKCANNYTFDNKFEIDSEPSFKILNNNNNYININNFLDNSTITNNNNITNISNNQTKNITDELPLNYSLKQKVFKKKIIGGVNLRASSINMFNKDKSYYNRNKSKSSSNNPIIEDKENIRNNALFKNKKFNGNYMELAKICISQEKIISNLVENVQQLNNKISDKDLCINELNNQLYSIKYDLLNTLQKTSGK